jgi:hypothetical protein
VTRFKGLTRPTIYIDSNIFSVLHYTGGDLIVLSQQVVTREWWQHESVHFDVFASSVTEGELKQGRYTAQAAAVAEVRRVKYLPFSRKVRECAADFVTRRIVPSEKPVDAIQLAFATVYAIDYLLTWNHAHLANVNVQARLKKLNLSLEMRVPLVVTPHSISKKAYGEEIRRDEKA